MSFLRHTNHKLYFICSFVPSGSAQGCKLDKAIDCCVPCVQCGARHTLSVQGGCDGLSRCRDDRWMACLGWG